MLNKLLFFISQEGGSQERRVKKILNGTALRRRICRVLKQLTHSGSTLRGRSPGHKAKIARALEDRVWPLLDRGLIAPVIDTTFALGDAAKAHQRMEEGEHFGKIMLQVA